MIKPVKTFRNIKIISLAILAIAASLVARGLSTGYSYWFDELYSISYSVGSWQDLYQHGIIDDVHPPLYQVILKLWTSLAGSSNEVTTRLLSYSFALLTLLAFCSDAITNSKWRRVWALAFVGASPLFTSYAQETRSYSLALLLATVVTLSILQLREKHKEFEGAAKKYHLLEAAFYIGCCLLSLVHYFGLIYVLVISMINFIEDRMPSVRTKSILLAAFIIIWPIWHILAGGIIGRTGGNFWIKVSPHILGTINLYLQGNLYFLSFGGPPSRTLISSAFIACILLVVIASWRKLYSIIFSKESESPTSDESKYLLYVVLTMVLLASLIDLHTPISTSRNFIVLLPATMILLTNCITLAANLISIRQWSTTVSILLSIVVLMLLLLKSQRELSTKIYPSENWKQLAAYVRESKVCTEGCLAIGSNGLHNYYFSDIPNISYIPMIFDNKQTIPYSNESLLGSSSNGMSKILGFKDAAQNINEYLGRGRETLVCLQPTQGSSNQTFIIIPKESLSGLEKKYGMRNCEQEI